MKITITGKTIATASHAHRVLHPHDDRETYVVYDVDGIDCVQLRSDTHGNVSLVPVTDLSVFDGELTSKKAGFTVKATDMPQVYTDDIKRLKSLYNFRVQREFLENWGSTINRNTIIDLAEVLRLCAEWDMPLADALDQLDEVTGDTAEACEVAQRIAESGEWILDDCAELCRLAGMEDEWNEADGDTFEDVVYAAAEKLDVDVL